MILLFKRTFFLKSFYNAFYKAFLITPFTILSPVLISISHEDTIETSLTSKKCRLANFCKVDAWSKALLFTGETRFSSRFFFNIPETSTQIQKLTKYLSTFPEDPLPPKFFNDESSRKKNHQESFRPWFVRVLSQITF